MSNFWPQGKRTKRQQAYIERLKRCLSLFFLLKTGNEIKNLAEINGVSVRTIQRDIVVLKMAGAKIKKAGRIYRLSGRGFDF